jgi:hypothetical protein
VEGSVHGPVELLSRNLPGGTRNNHEIPHEDSRCPSRDLTQRLPDTSVMVAPAYSVRENRIKRDEVVPMLNYSPRYKNPGTESKRTASYTPWPLYPQG